MAKIRLWPKHKHKVLERIPDWDAKKDPITIERCRCGHEMGRRPGWPARTRP